MTDVGETLALSIHYGLTAEDADRIWAVMLNMAPDETPSMFLRSFLSAAAEVGITPGLKPWERR